jgi:hypothetical protein
LRPSSGQDSLNFCSVRPPSEDDGQSRNFPISAVHTLRSFSLAGSRTASLQPLPPRPLPSRCAPRRPHSLRSVHRLWFDLRIGSEDPPACRMNTLDFISENESLTDRQPSGQHAVADEPSSWLHVCTSSTSTTGAFLRRQSRASLHCTQSSCVFDACLSSAKQTGKPAHDVPDKCQRECCSLPRRSKGCPLALRRPERG